MPCERFFGDESKNVCQLFAIGRAKQIGAAGLLAGGLRENGIQCLCPCSDVRTLYVRTEPAKQDIGTMQAQHFPAGIRIRSRLPDKPSFFRENAVQSIGQESFLAAD